MFAWLRLIVYMSVLSHDERPLILLQNHFVAIDRVLHSSDDRFLAIIGRKSHPALRVSVVEIWRAQPHPEFLGTFSSSALTGLVFDVHHSKLIASEHSSQGMPWDMGSVTSRRLVKNLDIESENKIRGGINDICLLERGTVLGVVQPTMLRWYDITNGGFRALDYRPLDLPDFRCGILSVPSHKSRCLIVGSTISMWELTKGTANELFWRYYNNRSPFISKDGKWLGFYDSPEGMELPSLVIYDLSKRAVSKKFAIRLGLGGGEWSSTGRYILLSKREEDSGNKTLETLPRRGAVVILDTQDGDFKILNVATEVVGAACFGANGSILYVSRRGTKYCIDGISKEDMTGLPRL